MALANQFELDPERRACARRLSRRIMVMIDYDRIWSAPMGDVAIRAAVVHRVEALLIAGEQDEALIIGQALQTVCGGRITSALRARLTSERAGLEHGNRSSEDDRRCPALQAAEPLSGLDAWLD
jgi:hypothetical protein